jgi:hypothetical protein
LEHRSQYAPQLVVQPEVANGIFELAVQVGKAPGGRTRLRVVRRTRRAATILEDMEWGPGGPSLPVIECVMADVWRQLIQDLDIHGDGQGTLWPSSGGSVGPEGVSPR